MPSQGIRRSPVGGIYVVKRRRDKWENFLAAVHSFVPGGYNVVGDVTFKGDDGYCSQAVFLHKTNIKPNLWLCDELSLTVWADKLIPSDH